MTDQDGPGPQALHERLQLGEPVQVEVVGRLVEQEHVVPAEQQRRQRSPRGLAPGQGGHGLIELRGQSQPIRDRAGPLVQVRPAEREPPFQRAGVVLVRAGRPGRQRVRGGLHRLVRRGDAGAPGQELPDGLARAPVRFLREVADRRARRAHRDRAGVGRAHACQHAQQRGLARAVHADQADDVAGGRHQVQAGEQEAVAVRGRQALGHEGGAHHDHISPARSGLSLTARVPAREAEPSVPAAVRLR